MEQNIIDGYELAKTVGLTDEQWKKCEAAYKSIQKRLSESGILASSKVDIDYAYEEGDEDKLVFEFVVKKPYKEVLKIWDGVSEEFASHIDNKTHEKVYVSMGSAETS